MGPRYAVRIPDVDYWLERVPCQTGCPVHTDSGRYVQLIAHGDPKRGYLTARSPNPLASVCGRVCAAPCEDRCRRGKIDKPVSIRALKRYLTERYGMESIRPGEAVEELRAGAPEPGSKWAWHLPRLVEATARKGAGRKVAVVGAGPAGLACAHDLALAGYAVTVFEASGRAGGMAFHGIPEFRLPRAVLDREIGYIESLGVTFRYKTPLTPQFGLPQLKAEGFEAVFLGVGVQKGRDLTCPGRELDGIVRAIDFLININNGYRVPAAKKVLVVGGGFVAFDAARTALRALAGESAPQEGGGMEPALDAARIAARAGAEVTLASLESFAEMPAQRSAQGQEELEQVGLEGVRFLPQRSIARFVGSAGRVEKVELIGVTRTYDENGRFAPVFDESIREEREADLVILAIGQQPDLSFLTPDDGIALTPARTIQVDRETLATSARGVFAGGDVAFGPRNLIEAEADGKRAAGSIHRLLSGQRPEPQVRLRFEKIPTRLYERDPAYELHEREAPPAVDVGRRSGIGEVEQVYTDEQARKQAERCLACHVQTIFHAERCVLCNRCVDVCPQHCLKLVPVEQLDLPAAELAAARRAGGADGEPASAMLKDDELCIRCGLCATRCPVDAMTMEVLTHERR